MEVRGQSTTGETVSAEHRGLALVWFELHTFMLYVHNLFVLRDIADGNSDVIGQLLANGSIQNFSLHQPSRPALKPRGLPSGAKLDSGPDGSSSPGSSGNLVAIADGRFSMSDVRCPTRHDSGLARTPGWMHQCNGLLELWRFAPGNVSTLGLWCGPGHSISPVRSIGS